MGRYLDIYALEYAFCSVVIHFVCIVILLYMIIAMQCNHFCPLEKNKDKRIQPMLYCTSLTAICMYFAHILFWTIFEIRYFGENGEVLFEVDCIWERIFSLPWIIASNCVYLFFMLRISIAFNDTIYEVRKSAVYFLLGFITLTMFIVSIVYFINEDCEYPNDGRTVLYYFLTLYDLAFSLIPLHLFISRLLLLLMDTHQQKQRFQANQQHDFSMSSDTGTHVLAFQGAVSNSSANSRARLTSDSKPAAVAPAKPRVLLAALESERSATAADHQLSPNERLLYIVTKNALLVIVAIVMTWICIGFAVIDGGGSVLWEIDATLNAMCIFLSLNFNDFLFNKVCCFRRGVQSCFTKCLLDGCYSHLCCNCCLLCCFADPEQSERFAEVLAAGDTVAENGHHNGSANDSAVHTDHGQNDATESVVVYKNNARANDIDDSPRPAHAHEPQNRMAMNSSTMSIDSDFTSAEMMNMANAGEIKT